MYKKLKIDSRVLVPIIVGLLFLSCDTLKELICPEPGDTYSFAAFDSTSTEIAKGWLRLEINSDGSVRGTWEIEAVGSPQNVGPMIGSDSLTGFRTGDSLLIELRPDYRDNNLSLIGRIDGRLLTGSWTSIGFAGPMATGTYKCLKTELVPFLR